MVPKIVRDRDRAGKVIKWMLRSTKRITRLSVRTTDLKLKLSVGNVDGPEVHRALGTSMDIMRGSGLPAFAFVVLEENDQEAAKGTGRLRRLKDVQGRGWK